jgi:AraC-like DNA-binding protein
LACSGRLPFTLFTTDDFPAKDRFDLWRENASPVFEVAPADPESSGADFHATLAAHHLGGLIVARADFDAQQFSRTRGKLTRDGLDHYQVQLYATGGLIGSAGERERVLSPGDIQILDLARPNLTAARRSETVALFVPRDLLNAALPMPGDLHGLVLRGDSAAGGLLADYMRSLLARAPAMTPEEAPPIAHAAINLVAACFRPTADLVARALPQIDAILLERMKCYIFDNLASRDLGPESLCRAFGVSRSRLYRLFEPLGGVAGYIQDRRLGRAMVELTSAAGKHRRNIDIALDWGFLSEAHFGRQFRRAFGMSPGEARARGSSNPVAAVMSAKSGPSHSDLGGWIARLRRG